MAETPTENPAELDQMTVAKEFIVGRNMFGPVRGEWDRQWNGWWGDDPPFHAPVFVLTHHRARAAADGRRHHLLLRHRRNQIRTDTRAKRPGTATFRSAAARAPSTSTSPPAGSTSYGCTLRRSRSAPARGCSTPSHH
jgi:hypothetical protein